MKRWIIVGVNIYRLKSLHVDTRIAAVKTLGRLGDRRAVRPLIKTLKDSDVSVRVAAAGALGNLGDRQAVEPLEFALRYEDGAMPRAAAEALGIIGDEAAIWILIRSLGHRDESTRKAATEALKRFGDKIIEPLIRSLGDWGNETHNPSTEALEQFGDRIVEPLIKALDHGNESVRRSAVRILGNLSDTCAVDPLIRMLDDKDVSVRLATVNALGCLGDTRAVEPLIKRLYDGNENIRVGQAAATELGKIGDSQAVEPLIKSLGCWEGSLRKSAALSLVALGEGKWNSIVKGNDDDFLSLGACGDTRALEPLVYALRYGDGLARKTAAEGLSTLNDVRAVDALIIALGDFDKSVRKMAADALSSLGHVKWCNVVKGNDDDFHNLGACGDTDAAEPLIVALGRVYSPTPIVMPSGEVLEIKPHEKIFMEKICQIRKAAAEALGNLGSKRSVEPLIEALRDKNDDSVRKAAAKALGRLSDTRAIKPLLRILNHKDNDMRKVVANALKMFGGDSLDLLVKTLFDRTEILGAEAAEALGNLGDRRAVEPLIKALDEEYGSVRGCAAKALGDLGGDARAIESLIKTLRDEHRFVRKAAATALIRYALSNPHVVLPGAQTIWQTIQTTHEDRRLSSSDCSDGGHIDNGIGMEVPYSLRSQTDF